MKKEEENENLLDFTKNTNKGVEEILKTQEINQLNILKRINCLVSILLFIFGILLLIDYVFYSEELTKIPEECFNKEECEFRALVPSKKSPLLFYLEYNNFNQNYRDYVNSFFQSQYNQEDYDTKVALERCWPLIRNKDFNLTKSVSGNDLKSKDIALPCGLIAKSYPKCKDTKNNLIFSQSKILKSGFSTFIYISV